MEEFLLVDGYNVIHAWPELAKLQEDNIEHARSKLVEILIDYAALTGQKVMVVFDAHLVKGGTGSDELLQGVRVIFSQEGETADMVIERMVGDLAARGRVFVATSDWAEQRMIFGHGAYRLTPRELYHQIADVKKKLEDPVIGPSPGEGRLEQRLTEGVKAILERWRRGKD